MPRFLSLIVSFSILVAAPLWAGEITVQGHGSVAQVPDMVTISLGARYQAIDAEDALEEVNERVAEIIEVAKSLGVEERDIQTRGVSLSPQWARRDGDDGARRIRGYVAGNQVSVKFRELDKLGVALDQIVSKGANTVNGLVFGLQDNDTPLNEARKRAVADGRQKAELYAEAAGVRLGGLLAITEPQTGPSMRAMTGRMMMESSEPSIAAGELSTEATVTMVYKIAE